MTEHDKEIQSAQQPDELHQLFVSGVNAHNIDALMALYEPDCVGADLEGHSLQGAETMRAFLSGFLTVVKQLDGKTQKLLVTGDIALMSSDWSAILATPGGEVVATGTSAEVARRQADGTWRFLIDDPLFLSASLRS